jgi:hypothetical protein
MGTKCLHVGAVLGLVVAVAACRADEKSEAEIAKLRNRVKQLEAENRTLRAAVAHLKGEVHPVPGEKTDKKRLDTDLRLLLNLDRSLKEKPNDAKMLQDAATLATRLAPELPGSSLIWRVLLKTRTLKDGMPLAVAEKLLGPPTDKSNLYVGWYFNPTGRHVAPYLHAKVTKQGLADWTLTRR